MHTNGRGIGSSSLPGVARLPSNQVARKTRNIASAFVRFLGSFGSSVRSCEEFATSQRTLPYPITLSNKNAAMHRALDGIAGVAC